MNISILFKLLSGITIERTLVECDYSIFLLNKIPKEILKDNLLHAPNYGKAQINEHGIEIKPCENLEQKQLNYLKYNYNILIKEESEDMYFVREIATDMDINQKFFDFTYLKCLMFGFIQENLKDYDYINNFIIENKDFNHAIEYYDRHKYFLKSLMYDLSRMLSPLLKNITFLKSNFFDKDLDNYFSSYELALLNELEKREIINDIKIPLVIGKKGKL